MGRRVAELTRLLESLDEAGRERATWWKVERAVLEAWVERIKAAEERPVGNGLVMRVDVRKGRTGGRE